MPYNGRRNTEHVVPLDIPQYGRSFKHPFLFRPIPRRAAPMRASEMSFLDILADLLLVRGTGAPNQSKESKPARRLGFARGNVRYRQGKIHTEKQLDEERVEFQKSLERTDY